MTEEDVHSRIHSDSHGTTGSVDASDKLMIQSHKGDGNNDKDENRAVNTNDDSKKLMEL